MKKSSRRYKVFSFCLCLIMLLSSFPITNIAFAETTSTANMPNAVQLETVIADQSIADSPRALETFECV
ncbi:MAG: hypothetical protein UH851_03240, partial [Clostridia bacterium]|nr:hypothetical protein [Clostridia bacterium]